jgi:xanthine dehydrogenase YagS FAD-binding subunit
MLHGIKATKDHFEAVAETMVRGALGFGHNTFKIELARRAVIRALQHAVRMGKSA